MHYSPPSTSQHVIPSGLKYHFIWWRDAAKEGRSTNNKGFRGHARQSLRLSKEHLDPNRYTLDFNSYEYWSPFSHCMCSIRAAGANLLEQSLTEEESCQVMVKTSTQHFLPTLCCPCLREK